MSDYEPKFRKLTIAVDFDDTFTAAPALFALVIKAAVAAGHKVICVTARKETEALVDMINAWFDFWDCQVPIYFTNLREKIGAMADRGIKVDIWMDDNPAALVMGY